MQLNYQVMQLNYQLKKRINENPKLRIKQKQIKRSDRRCKWIMKKPDKSWGNHEEIRNKCSDKMFWKTVDLVC